MDNNKFLAMLIPRGSFYLWFILVLLAIMMFNGLWFFAVPGFILLSLLAYYYFRSNNIRRREIAKFIENLTFNIDSASKDTLLNFPMPLLVVELDGSIIWYNPHFRKLFEGDAILEKTVGILVGKIKPQTKEKDRVCITEEISICGKNYYILGNFVKKDIKHNPDEYILMLYFIDNTELTDIKKKYNNEKLAIGLIIIDNYDELMQSTEDTNRPHMLAEIDQKINQWVTFTHGLIKKFEREKYLFVFEKRYLKDFEEKKFEVLDIVKEINTGNSIPVTLSIGFGLNGENVLGSFKFAGAAMDIALGRGGDQVVVKDMDNVSFYGGKTRELEKRTRVKARVIAYALRELIEQAPRVLIMGHDKSDIDSLGAALGIYRIVKNRGKNAHIVLSESNPSIENIVQKIKNNAEYDNLFVDGTQAFDMITSKTLLIIVDTHRAIFTDSPELVAHTDQVVVIDHHRRGSDFIQDAVLTYQETYASSTCELVTEILQYVDEKIKLKPIEAEALYSGIVVDTKNFTFKTGVRTFEAAAYLRRQGVDTLSVKQLFQNDLHSYINISNIVKEVEMFNGNMAISCCPKNVKSAQLISAQAADQILSLTGIVAAFVLSYADNEIVISGRSLGDINVQMILEKLGGGGHLSIAGTQIEKVSMEEAKERLKNAIKEYLASVNNKES